MSQWQPHDPRRQQAAAPPPWSQQPPPQDPWAPSQPQYQQPQGWGPQPSYQPPPQPPRRRKSNKGLRIFAWCSVGFLGLVVLIIALGAKSGSPSAAASSPAVSASAAAAAAPAALAPLTLASFPSTADGRLARGTCRAWAALRGQYAARLATDSPYQLNQWFSGPDWHTAWSDANELGDDPAYSNLETAYGTATNGDTAGVPWARLLDKACADGD